MSGELIDTSEMYLRTIYELHEEDIEPLRARIVERLHHSGPTVSQTVNRLARDGLLSIEDDRHLELSDFGWRTAVSVMRKHRLAECMLFEQLGMPWDVLHDEACRLEHVMSDEMEARLTETLGDPQFGPYGTPIPPADLNVDPDDFRAGLVALSQIVDDSEGPCKLVRLSEFVQAYDGALSELFAAGIMPGFEFEATMSDRRLDLQGPDAAATLPEFLADGIWVAHQG